MAQKRKSYKVKDTKLCYIVINGKKYFTSNVIRKYFNYKSAEYRNKLKETSALQRIKNKLKSVNSLSSMDAHGVDATSLMGLKPHNLEAQKQIEYLTKIGFFSFASRRNGDTRWFIEYDALMFILREIGYVKDNADVMQVVVDLREITLNHPLQMVNFDWHSHDIMTELEKTKSREQRVEKKTSNSKPLFEKGPVISNKDGRYLVGKYVLEVVGNNIRFNDGSVLNTTTKELIL